MNMRLKQRARSPLDDQTLVSFLDAINFDILDDDLILLNQMATIKRLANRTAFSISDKQIALLHRKFANLYEQRTSTSPGGSRNNEAKGKGPSFSAYERPGGRRPADERGWAAQADYSEREEFEGQGYYGNQGRNEGYASRAEREPFIGQGSGRASPGGRRGRSATRNYESEPGYMPSYPQQDNRGDYYGGNRGAQRRPSGARGP